MAERKNMVIHYNDHSKVAFDFPEQVQEPARLMKHIDKVLTMPYVIVKAEGAMLLYPRENIKAIQVYPAPDKLPDYVISGARATGKI